ncbi:holo-ACP synthase [Bombiscardovia coagulans]|uniref:Holo-[acyl-carrier-protein] synthase n=1 Tax=Bombiscardovia coagulans TaxID=686666 RepID=A0A261EU63_9BIFI|nr:holo-ACP synthase [Bombiscardovia coagulans]OZG50398.1 4'-phosphopantetheinyl transferase family protein [Bombiscardovia coagulans]
MEEYGVHGGLNRVLGIGHDLVDVGAFEGLLQETGSRMRQLFSVRELRQAEALAASKGDASSLHLAAKWAGKESVLKAWCTALGSQRPPYTVDTFPWAEVEVIDDVLGRPGIYLSQTVEAQLAQSMKQQQPLMWLISISHDGPVASAVVLLGL